MTYWPELHNAQTRERAWNKRVRGADLVMNRINHQATMVKKRLKNLVNVVLLSSGGGGMFVRVLWSVYVDWEPGV